MAASCHVLGKFLVPHRHFFLDAPGDDMAHNVHDLFLHPNRPRPIAPTFRPRDPSRGASASCVGCAQNEYTLHTHNSYSCSQREYVSLPALEDRRRVEPLRAHSTRAGLPRPPGLSAACGGGVRRRSSASPPGAPWRAIVTPPPASSLGLQMTGKPLPDRAAGWTPDRLDLLHLHFALGMTAAESADALGGVSRNAVLCKRLRLGLSSRGCASGGDLAGVLAGRGYRPTDPPPLPCLPLPVLDVVLPAGARPSPLAGRGRRDCAWPLGPAHQPGDYLTLYCCAPRAGRSAYCPVHADVARWRG
jgi:hypothetical protein